MLKVMVVDDEPLARQRLALLVNESAASGGPVARVVAEAADARQALAWLSAHDADVVLLDVQMPGLDGMGLAGKLAALPRPPAVVFVTAHPQHALRAFELEAVDYLTKPVRRERLWQALQRVQRRTDPAMGDVSKVSSAGPSAIPSPEPVLVVTERGRLERIPLSRVLYLKAELKYVTLRTPDGSFILDDTLTDLEGRYPTWFLRVHRNALVARHAVQGLERSSEAGNEPDGWSVRIRLTSELVSISKRLLRYVKEEVRHPG